MSFGKWVVGGLIGGVIGAAIWAAISYFTNYEIGWIAWGIGFIVGLGVRIAAGEQDGYAPGITAAAIAILAIVAGKYAAVSLMVDKALQGPEMAVTADDLIVQQADEIVAARMDKGQKVQWPPNMSADEAVKLADYPADVAAEATQAWQKLGADEQKKRIEEAQQQRELFRQHLGGALRNAGFEASFSGWDILWFILATMTAFRLGSGATSDD